MDHRVVEQWVEGYERAWRTPGTDSLAELFTPDATYLPSPWSAPVTGLAAIADFWESEREGPDEDFTLSSEVVAVEDVTAVARTVVTYARAPSPRWRNLWVIRFDDDGRCAAFEEWPFRPDQPDGHEA
jgi:uncharacterized protein (TIGR02246 family)